MKKILTIFLVMMFVMVGVVSAGPSDYFFTEDGGGEADLINEAGLGNDGSDYFVRLYLPGPHVNADDAKLRIPYMGTLESLTTFSFWTKVVGTDGELHPYGSMNIDSDSTPESIEYVIVQWEVGSYPPTGVDTWIQTVWDDDTKIHVVDANTGVAIAGFTQTDAAAGTATLGALKAETGWLDYNVVQVKVAVGMWAHTYALEGFVDDVQINEVIYDFELTNVGGEGADFIALTIPDSINYGNLYSTPGFETAAQAIDLINVGSLDIVVTPVLESSDEVFGHIKFSDASGGTFGNIQGGVVDGGETEYSTQPIIANLVTSDPLVFSETETIWTKIKIAALGLANKIVGPQTGTIYFQAVEA